MRLGKRGQERGHGVGGEEMQAVRWAWLGGGKKEQSEQNGNLGEPPLGCLSVHLCAKRNGRPRVDTLEGECAVEGKEQES